MAHGKTMNRSRLRDQSRSPLASQRPGACFLPVLYRQDHLGFDRLYPSEARELPIMKVSDDNGGVVTEFSVPVSDEITGGPDRNDVNGQSAR
jgi:hypothetical protein